MPDFEMNTRRVIAPLERDGWKNSGGKEHDKFKHPGKSGRIIVPRHRELSPGVAQKIAKLAGWI